MTTTPRISTTLLLDHAGLNTLFPEGSEARVELRRVATTSFVNHLFHKGIKMPADSEKLFTNAISELKARMETTLDKARLDYAQKFMQDADLAKMMKPQGWEQVTSFELTDSHKKRIETEVRSAFSNLMAEHMQNTLPPLIEQYLKPERFSHYIEEKLKKLLADESMKAVTALLNGNKS